MFIREFFAPPNNCNDNENTKITTATEIAISVSTAAATLASVTWEAELRRETDSGGEEMLRSGRRLRQGEVQCPFPGAALAKVTVGGLERQKAILSQMWRLEV